jgi:hypothetical protein
VQLQQQQITYVEERAAGVVSNVPVVQDRVPMIPPEILTVRISLPLGYVPTLQFYNNKIIIINHPKKSNRLGSKSFICILAPFRSSDFYTLHPPPVSATWTHSNLCKSIAMVVMTPTLEYCTRPPPWRGLPSI